MKKIAIGCGKRNYGHDWIHVDQDDTFLHVVHLNPYLSEFGDESVDLIYACHLIAYWDKDGVMPLLKAWYDRLKKGGILRIATPDFEEIAHLYVGSGIYDHIHVKLDDILGPLYGKWPDGNGRTIYHKTVWDFSSLQVALSKIGFKDIRLYDWQDTEHAHIDDHSQAYLNPKGDKENGTLISLNIECTK